MKKFVILLLILGIGGLIFYVNKKNAEKIDENIRSITIFDTKKLETNKGFIRYVGTANGKYYADIDFTEKNPCETPGIENDLECEGSSDNKNENKTTKSILIADNVTFFDVGCYYYDKSLKENSFFKIESLVILMQEMQNTPFSKCGYSDEHQDTRLYFFNFNKYGEIRSIASDQIYNQ